MKSHFHFFHIVPPSPWPFLTGLVALSMLSSTVLFLKLKLTFPMTISTMFLFIIMLLWWKDVKRESMLGDHSFFVQDSLKMGMVLFIFSEVMFFVSWFWAFFHSSLVATPELGSVWPPYALQTMNPFQVPLLNTIILLSSGVTVTCAHHNLIKNSSASTFLFFTILLGMLFTTYQALEYSETFYSIADSVFGSSFFVTTGFHGLHVLIGTAFLIYVLIQVLKLKVSFSHHLGVEFAIWYWHFVDVVWLFLFSFLYWWTV